MATNTRDLIGDQNTLDGLVSGTLTSLVENGIKTLAGYSLHRYAGISDLDFANLRRIQAYAIRYCNNLLSLNIPSVEEIGAYGMSNCPALFSLNLPKIQSISYYAMSDCSGLNIVDCGDGSDTDIYFNQGVFNGCGNLTHLIIRNTVPARTNVALLSGTAINVGNGAIYVPSNLVDTYKEATNWCDYANQIYSIEEYPKLDFSTITDTWEDIFAAEEDGTYLSKYSIGDTKAFTIGGVIFLAEIVAFDADLLADNSGDYAHITWILTTLYDGHRWGTDTSSTQSIEGSVVHNGVEYRFTSQRNSHTDNTWGTCELRNWLQTTVLSDFQQVVANNIKIVKKSYYDSFDQETKYSSDSLWVPSYRELAFSESISTSPSGLNIDDCVYQGTYYPIEESGAVYSDTFANVGNVQNPRKTMYYYGNMNNGSYWLRTTGESKNIYNSWSTGEYNENDQLIYGAVQSDYIQPIYMNGSSPALSYHPSSTPEYVCIGFCT